jgi:hypothetical protein
MKITHLRSVVVSVVSLGIISTAGAGLSPVGIWTGNVGLSLDAVGSNNDPVGNIRADIPVGATVLAAYLYSAGTPYPYYTNSPTTVSDYNNSGITLNGTAITDFSAIVGASALPARPDLGNFYTGRANVTSLIQSLATGGPDYSWSVQEGTLNDRIDGEVLAVVYSASSEPTGSVVLLDGGLNTSGETTTIGLGAPLGNVSDPAFSATMSLADSFSYDAGNPSDTQYSDIDVNGTRLTSSAGGFGNLGQGYDGGLINVGSSFNPIENPADPFSHDTSQDDLRYNLQPFLSTGDTSFTIYSDNPSNDDNIFMMGLQLTATVTGVNHSVPDLGSTALLLALSVGGLAAARRRLAKA